MVVRSAMHRAGAAALNELLDFPAPAKAQHAVDCPCGQAALYRELRSKPVLTAVGPVQVSRPYYFERTEFSPGVRRMQALVGQQAPFDHGREQLKVLAGLEVTTKSVERSAETIGAEIAQQEQQQIQRAVQLDLPIPIGRPIPTL